MNPKRILSVVLTMIILSTSVIPTFAATTQDKLNDAKSDKQQIESSLNETKSRIDGLSSQKRESESYLAELNAQLEELQESLEELKNESEKKQTELEKVQKELEKAKQQEERQYEDMKLRIQFMYEKSSGTYLEMLLSAETFSEFLNRAENISQISEYDRDMLADYQDIKEKIAEKEIAVVSEKEAIEVLRQESARKQEEVEVVVATTYNQINEYATEINDAESEEAIFLSKIRQQESAINTLLKQAKDEEAAADKAKAAQEQAQKAASKSVASNETATANKAPEKSVAQQQTSSSNETNKETVVETAPAQEAASEPEESNESSGSGSGSYLGNFKLTAYCNCSSCCGKWSGGATASGTTPTPGRTVAMGGVAFGTKLSINGSIYTVEDRGTAYGHVDVYMGSHSQALSFGVQYAEVYIVN